MAVSVVLLIFATLASAEGPQTPRLRVGAKLVRMFINEPFIISDSLGVILQIAHRDPYVGAVAEVVYGPLFWCHLRMDMAGYEVFDAGGSAVTLLESPCLDVLVEPPVSWRVVPYGWVGLRITRWWGSQTNPDPRFFGTADHEFRAGLGAKYLLNSRVELFGESQWFTDYTFLNYVPDRSYPSGYWTRTWVALSRVDVGVRIGLNGLR